jgi:hypothetical protein
MAEASNSEDMYTKRQRIAQLARQSPQMGFAHLRELVERRVRDGEYRSEADALRSRMP